MYLKLSRIEPSMPFKKYEQKVIQDFGIFIKIIARLSLFEPEIIKHIVQSLGTCNK